MWIGTEAKHAQQNTAGGPVELLSYVTACGLWRARHQLPQSGENGDTRTPGQHSVRGEGKRELASSRGDAVAGTVPRAQHGTSTTARALGAITPSVARTQGAAANGGTVANGAPEHANGAPEPMPLR